MFERLKNIDTAFRHVRTFTLVIIACCTTISLLVLYQSFSTVNRMQDKIYILSGGKVLQAEASQRRDNIPVEARDHIRTFHELFFTLDPDDKAIRDHITSALYMADGSAKRTYDDLRENGYYAGIISGNISQRLTVDSIQVVTDNYPYRFRCYGRQEIVRPTSILTRSLVTEGQLRNVSRSDNNPHGFLIERWETIENRDLKTENRN
ncbi:conjugative transposon protein TraK [Flavobacterium rakeshii]|uniref:Conjugative transposon protein TraK n=1 Tax=Flavobacterium rakeshii TaxID=1038845 RepID=A0A6N8HFV7_9FLAO|nr:conjugative transposon protein TraK [Flavobacterium rakeshii]MUV04583.1 conjugative transposon protein TraK [Flavobacterium rakeshii]